MNWNRIIVLWALGVFCVGCQRNETAPTTESAAGAKRQWLTDFERAQEQARTENKMLLLNFTGSDWCAPCIMLHRQIFSQSEFVQYAAKNLVLLEVDFPHNKAQTDEQKEANGKLADRYGIYGFPTEIVLDANGKKIGELGYMSGGPKPFIAALEKLRHAGGTGASER